jgi:hypothetical protein
LHNDEPLALIWKTIANSYEAGKIFERETKIVYELDGIKAQFA